MKKERVFFRLMFLTLIVIGILQFFDTPKFIDYILGIIAICFSIVGYVIKFKK